MKRNLSALVAAGAVVFGVAVAGVAGGAETSISVDYVAAEPVSEQCVGQDAISMDLDQDDDSLSYAFTLANDLCNPIAAKAAIYAIPDSWLLPWPQTLVSVEEFTLSAAGTTTVTFAKGCDPQQFDVLTGATPQVINSGLDHGPLLVAPTGPGGAYGSAIQYRPPAGSCTDNTTSTSSTTTSTTTTSEVPVTVSPETTVPSSVDPAGDVNDPATQPAATVGGISATQGAAALSVAG